jgi:allantoin racemase
MAAIRLWYQSMAPIRSLGHYTAALASHARRACSDGVEVVFNGVTEERYRGRLPADVLKYPFAKLVFQAEAIDFCRKAEADGFDAVILGSFSEPFLAEIRSILDIPVVSLAEASLLTACSLAEQFALVTLAPANVKRLRALVRRHGLETRIVAIHALDRAVDEADLDAAFTAPERVVADFTGVAGRAVEAGADLVVPAEGVLNEVLFANGVRTIAQATVLDCVGTALLQVALKRRLGIGVGRRWSYAKPPPDLLDEMMAFR